MSARGFLLPVPPLSSTRGETNILITFSPIPYARSAGLRWAHLICPSIESAADPHDEVMGVRFTGPKFSLLRSVKAFSSRGVPTTPTPGRNVLGAVVGHNVSRCVYSEMRAPEE